MAYRLEGWVMELVWMFREVEEGGGGEWHIGLKAG